MRIIFIIIMLYFYSPYSLVKAKTSFPSYDVFTSTEELSLGGAGYLSPSIISSKLNPAFNFEKKIFSSAILKYPALITSESIGIGFPVYKGFGSFSIRHVSYGIFQGYNESFEKNNDYNVNDLWIRGTYSKNIFKSPLRIGISSQIFKSSLGIKEVYLVEFSFGTILRLNTGGSELGVSIHQLGKEFDKKAQIDMDTKLVFSASKELKHLPLNIYFDTIMLQGTPGVESFLGLVFTITDQLKFKIGTSSRKLNQDVGESLTKSILGATGFGFGYNFYSLEVNYANFIYGTGISVHGLEVSIPLKL